jgi:hypothetical protein
MSKPKFAVAFAVLLGWCALAAAADLLEPTPLDRPLRGTRDPLEWHDPPEFHAPLMHGESRMLGDLRPRPLPGEHEPLIGEPFLESPGSLGPRPYRENEPLFVEPPARIRVR